LPPPAFGGAVKLCQKTCVAQQWDKGRINGSEKEWLSMTHDIWGEVQDALLSSVGENNYKTWIRPLEFATCENGVVHFNVPTNFIGNWVNRNYSDQILRHLHSAGVSVRRIEFIVGAPQVPAVLADDPTTLTAPAPVV
jgi:chromosomal replication initiator protein